MLKSLKMSPSESLMLSKFLCIKKRSLVPFLIYTSVAQRFCAFLWGFSGRSLKMPSKKELQKATFYAKLYTHLKENNFSGASIVEVKKAYGLRHSRVQAIIDFGKRSESAFDKMFKDHVDAHSALLAPLELKSEVPATELPEGEDDGNT